LLKTYCTNLAVTSLNQKACCYYGVWEKWLKYFQPAIGGKGIDQTWSTWTNDVEATTSFQSDVETFLNAVNDGSVTNCVIKNSQGFNSSPWVNSRKY